MLRISKAAWAAALLALTLLPFPATAQDTLISQEDIEKNMTRYKTVNVETGNYEEAASGNSTVVYVERYRLKYEGPEARFLEYKVRENSQVEAGQVIATFEVEADPVAIYQKELQLQRALENQQSQMERLENAVREKQAACAGLSDPFALRRAQLETEKAQVQCQKYEMESAREIQRIQQQLDDLRANAQTQTICAPIDGVVERLAYLTPRQTVRPGTVVSVVYNPKEMLVQFDNSEGKLHYHMPVTLVGRYKGNRVEYGGRVVATGNVLPQLNMGSSALIAMELPDYMEDPPLRPTVKFATRKVENVMLVSSRAVTLYGGNVSVDILGEDGQVSKRYINQVQGPGSSQAWVLMGVAPGDTLILK